MHIDSYSFGRIVVDGEVFGNDIIIFPGRIKEEWWREKGHLLQWKDIEEAAAEKPDHIIIGTGASGMMEIAEDVAVRLKERGIGFTICPTDEAVKLFNRMTGKNVVCALHLTC